MESHYTDSVGNQFWFAHDDLDYFHRESGPAVITVAGDQIWYFHNELHRLDGPAILRANGGETFVVNGVQILYCELERWMSDHEINQNWRQWSDQEKMLFKFRFG